MTGRLVKINLFLDLSCGACRWKKWLPLTKKCTGCLIIILPNTSLIEKSGGAANFLLLPQLGILRDLPLKLNNINFIEDLGSAILLIFVSFAENPLEICGTRPA
jgi:hypothetical protein